MSTTSPAQPIKVYSSPLSGHAHRVRLLLSFLNLPHEVVNMSMAELKTPAFLAKNPLGQIPVVEDGDFVLADSVAILVYLATQYDDGTWLPRGARQAAAVQRWLSFASSEIAAGPNTARLVKQFKAPLDHGRAKSIAEQFFAFIEQDLSKTEFAIGDQPTIADVAAYAYIALAPEGDVSLEPYPAIRAWLQRIEVLPRFVPMHKGSLATLGA